MDVIMVYEMMVGQVFDFAVKQDSPIQSVKDLAGKTIALGDAGWQVIVDPILVEAGVDPKSITYVAVGAQWGQAVALGKADIALTWEGLRAQWDAQGLGLRYLLGQDFSKMPANGIGRARIGPQGSRQAGPPGEVPPRKQHGDPLRADQSRAPRRRSSTTGSRPSASR